jgi:hypothetical protein
MDPNYRGYVVSFFLNDRSMEETVYANDDYVAREMIKNRYGSSVTYVAVARKLPSANEIKQKENREAQERANKQYAEDKKRKEEENQRQREHQRVIDEQNRRIAKLEARTYNMDYKEQAKVLHSEVQGYKLLIDNWQKEKNQLNREINHAVTIIQQKIKKYMENANAVQGQINTINTRISEHNNQKYIYSSNTVSQLNPINRILETDIDFFPDAKSSGFLHNLKEMFHEYIITAKTIMKVAILYIVDKYFLDGIVLEHLISWYGVVSDFMIVKLEERGWFRH